MKTLRLLLVAALLLLAAATTPASAQTADPFIGYLPLLSRVDPNLPIRVQSQRALNRIMPSLLALQADGVIAEFEPELSVGVLKVKYSAASALSTLAGIQIYSDIRDAMISAPQTKRLTPGIAASGPNFSLQFYSSCFYAENLPADSHIVGSLRNNSRVVANYEGDADGTGNLFGCFFSIGSFSNVVPGHKLTFKVYDSTPMLLGTYVSVVPTIEFMTIDNAHAIVGGKGPAGKSYDIVWLHPNLNVPNTAKFVSRSGTISGAGKWSEDLGTTRFRGGDLFRITVQQNARFAFTVYQDVPGIYCQLGSNYCNLFGGKPLQPATLSVRHSGVTYTASGTFSLCGCFSHLLAKNGKPVYLKTGDRVSGTSVAAYTLPNLTAAANFSSDVVSGKVPANKYFELWAYDPYISAWASLWSHSNASGNYSGDFNGLIDFDATTTTSIEVYYTDPITGNETDYFRSYGP